MIIALPGLLGVAVTAAMVVRAVLHLRRLDRWPTCHVCERPARLGPPYGAGGIVEPDGGRYLTPRRWICDAHDAAIETELDHAVRPFDALVERAPVV